MHTQEIVANGDRAHKISRPAKLLKQCELARELGVAENTVRSWKGCPRIFIGKKPNGKARRVRYDLEDVKAWLKQARSC